MDSLKICGELRKETVVVLTLLDNQGMCRVGGLVFKDIFL